MRRSLPLPPTPLRPAPISHDVEPIDLAVIPSDAPILALDLGASRTRAAVVDADGRIVQRVAARTPVEAGPAGVIRESISLLRSVRDAAPAAVRERLAGVGIAAPGPVQPSTGMLIEPPNLGPAFRDVPLAGPIGAAMGLPAMLERDTNVAALAEWDFGSARATHDFLYLTVSTGIGGAIVTGGRLMRGPDGVAGELGHVVVDIDGPPCGCGAPGHLEAISSGTGIAHAAAKAIAAETAPGLTERRRTVARPLTARDVAAAEDAGDADAAAIMDRARSAFAEACVGFVDVFNPELIVVGGSLARNQGERWLGPARDRIAKLGFRIHRARVRVVPAELGDDVGLVGALPLLRGRAGA